MACCWCHTISSYCTRLNAGRVENTQSYNGLRPGTAPDCVMKRQRLHRSAFFGRCHMKPSEMAGCQKWKMGVSKNSGTPESSILIGFSIINHPFWVPLFLETSKSCQLVGWQFSSMKVSAASSNKFGAWGQSWISKAHRSLISGSGRLLSFKKLSELLLAWSLLKTLRWLHLGPIAWIIHDESLQMSNESRICQTQCRLWLTPCTTRLSQLERPMVLGYASSFAVLRRNVEKAHVSHRGCHVCRRWLQTLLTIALHVSTWFILPPHSTHVFSVHLYMLLISFHLDQPLSCHRLWFAAVTYILLILQYTVYIIWLIKVPLPISRRHFLRMS